jgi:hypothetical protein
MTEEELKQVKISFSWIADSAPAATERGGGRR